ncbi:MAG TPA: 50S ribosomal protein L29 [Armatimonadota bacterium]|nr:50S ribosomal protein L29 [Armatimonadota bacterium]
MKLGQLREHIRQSPTTELEHMLAEERKSLFMCLRDSASKQLENPRKIRQIRKNIARILTILSQRERESAEAK